MEIKIIGAGKSFGGKELFSDLSLTFSQGEKYCLAAPSGWGKTTLLRCVMGLDTLDKGQILGLDGAKISAVFQEDRLCEDFSAFTNIKIAAPKSTNDNDIKALMEKILPPDSFDKKCSKLSGGMRRRAAICRALCCESSVVIMDEPFTGLDTDTKSAVYQFILNNLGERTLIFVSHNEEDCVHLGGRIIRLDLL